MADTSTRENLTECVVKQYAAYIKDKVRRLQEVLNEFPEENVKLKFPSLSIFSLAPTFRALSPYPYRKDVIQNHKTKVYYCVGIYDFKLQIDLWCKNKEERNDVFDLLFLALNPNINPMGLSLQLQEYYNIWCRYDLIGHQFMDTEEGNQRNEWRAKLDVLASCKAVIDRTDYIMTDVDQPEPDVSESEDY